MYQFKSDDPARQNGPVIVYKMVPGHSKEELARWPEDLRQEYEERFGKGGDADEIQP